MNTEQIIKLAREAGLSITPARISQYNGGSLGGDAVSLRRFADLVAQAERERICAAIKAEDDHCSTGDYMLDSDDCIMVARGQWQRPDFDCADNDPCKRTAPGLALESGEFVPASEIAYHPV